MRREIERQPSATLVGEPAEGFVGAGNLPGIPAGGGRVADSERVGLRLVVAPVLEHQQPERLFGGAAVATERRREDAGQPESQPGQLLLRDLPRRVSRGDVADFVPEHAGELRLRVEVGEDAARDVDVAAGHRERVDDRIVEHGEVPVEVGQLADLREPLSDAVHVSREPGVVVLAVLGDRRRKALATDLLLLLGADQRELSPAGRRVDRAARSQGEERAAGEHAREPSSDAPVHRPSSIQYRGTAGSTSRDHASIPPSRSRTSVNPLARSQRAACRLRTP